MKLIDGDRIITAQLYDDEYEEFTEKKMSIIDFVNAYTDEGVTEADVRWIPVSERLPEEGGDYLVTMCYDLPRIGTVTETRKNFFCISSKKWLNDDNEVTAWMPLPESYQPKEDE